MDATNISAVLYRYSTRATVVLGEPYMFKWRMTDMALEVKLVPLDSKRDVIVGRIDLEAWSMTRQQQMALEELAKTMIWKVLAMRNAQ